MVSYRCYFLNDHNRIAGVSDIAACSDQSAVAKALGALAREARHLTSVEVWQGVRMIERALRAAPQVSHA